MSDSPKPKKTASKRAAAPKAAAKGKKRKDPNAPKRPLTAYILFSNAKRDQVKKENPDIKFGEVAKRLSDLWKDCSTSEKSKFEELAAKDKKRFEKEMDDFEKRGGGGDDDDDEPKKKKTKAPKKPAKKEESEEDDDDDDDDEDDE